jgi:uncharacterized nucleotidyltransferase DUF6036
MPRRTRSAAARVLADLGRALGRLRIEWYLFGAQAAVLRGLRRNTADVDITVFTELDGEQLAGRLARAFALRVPDAAGFAKRTHVLPLIHNATKMDVDVVLGTLGLETHFLERSEIVDVEGVPVRVPLLADLVVMKLIAGRPRDIEDAYELVAFEPARVPRAEIRAALAEIEQAIGEGGLVERWDAVERRVPGPAKRDGGRPSSRRRR